MENNFKFKKGETVGLLFEDMIREDVQLEGLCESCSELPDYHLSLLDDELWLDLGHALKLTVKAMDFKSLGGVKVNFYEFEEDDRLLLPERWLFRPEL